jgi:hypothetical protein
VPPKKKWTKPEVRSLDCSDFESWNREKLLRLRDLLHRALEIVEDDDQSPEAIAGLFQSFKEIESELAK